MKKLLLTAVLLAATPALAQEDMDHGAHTGHGMGGAEGPSTEAYRAANDRMHAGMGGMAYTGNADVDFITGMIPHHQGAVDMAKIVLEHGTDPEVRALAEKVIAAQEAEIKWMQDWLARQPK
ncbi:hypothetical protein GCM10011452_08260 [Gemmobacter lanyuensis]|uniref:DUF305 domain-containing protein n=1 Tax=Gemmobacter lanyuensis TaxID=1054497 RepID=A0A918IPY3_9RHOB|nr:DUF305 domain-containing protein [Gemmobacter lanyuensis]GGW23495.1 hypothetical protein GCM10011452_08260 [Gemmobacter lanyuensis]